MWLVLNSQERLSYAWPEHLSVSPGTATPLHNKAPKQEGESLHAQHTKREDHRTSKPVHSPVMQKAQVQALALLCFHTADKHPKHSPTVSVSSWLHEYWIYYNGLVSDPKTNFSPSLLPSRMPSFPPDPPNYQLLSPIATSHVRWPLQTQLLS